MNKIEKAIIFATEAHQGVNRKGKNRPYILHPLEVMTIVAGLTDDEDVIAAAVLHDTVEDAGVTLTTLEEKFGKRVAELVGFESENKREDQPAEETWKTRKQETIVHLKTADRDVKLICLGDKLANIREISRDYAQLGNELWKRFNQKDKNLHRWYYSSVCDILAGEFGQVLPIAEYRALLVQVFGEKGEKNA